MRVGGRCLRGRMWRLFGRLRSRDRGLLLDAASGGLRRFGGVEMPYLRCYWSRGNGIASWRWMEFGEEGDVIGE